MNQSTTVSFERLVASMSASIGDSKECSQRRVRGWLKQVGALHHLGGVTFERAPPDGDPVEVHTWSVSPDFPPVMLQEREFPFVVERARRGKLLVAADVNRLPVQARVDRDSFRRHGVRAALSIPVRLNGNRFDMLALGYGRPRAWSDGVVTRLQLLGRMFATVMAGASSDDAARRANNRSGAILKAIPGRAAVLDQAGRVIEANERWLSSAKDRQAFFANAGIGASYLDILSTAESAGDVRAAMLARAVSSVLRGNRESVSVPCFPASVSGGPSLVARIDRLPEPEGGAVLVFSDATRQYQAEEDARRLRGELAHMQRVATVGELAGAFVHELKQPLTAILSNAQAGQRLLRHRRPDFDEIAAVLGDISASDRRARDLLQGLHSFLRPGEMAMETVNLNALIREVMSLCQSDVRLGQVEASLSLDPRLPLVLGDKIQLQQVVLNLLLNALDALGQWQGTRRVHLRTACRTNHLVRVMISDSGPGIPRNRLTRIFESFFTTKPQGLGMGLAIARTIVRAHGGDLRAANNRRGGASVTMTLPSVAKDAI